MSEDVAVTVEAGDTNKRIAATGSVIGAVLASSCCGNPEHPRPRIDRSCRKERSLAAADHELSIERYANALG